MPDPNNPLSYIGASNDPSLTQRTVDTNRSLQEMRRNLGQIASESGYARQLEGQKGRAALQKQREMDNANLIRSFITKNIDLGGSDPYGQLEELRTSENAARNIKTILDLANTGRETLTLPGSTVQEATSLAQKTIPMPPLGLSTAAAGRPQTTYISGLESGRQLDRVILTEEGLAREKLTEDKKDQTQQKNVVEGHREVTDKVTRDKIINEQRRRGKDVSQIESIERDDSNWYVYFADGTVSISPILVPASE